MDSLCRLTLFPDVNAIYQFDWVNSKNNVSQRGYFGVFSIESFLYLVFAFASGNNVSLQKLSVMWPEHGPRSFDVATKITVCDTFAFGATRNKTCCTFYPGRLSKDETKQNKTPSGQCNRQWNRNKRLSNADSIPCLGSHGKGARGDGVAFWHPVSVAGGTGMRGGGSCQCGEGGGNWKQWAWYSKQKHTQRANERLSQRFASSRFSEVSLPRQNKSLSLNKRKSRLDEPRVQDLYRTEQNQN